MRTLFIAVALVVLGSTSFGEFSSPSGVGPTLGGTPGEGGTTLPSLTGQQPQPAVEDPEAKERKIAQKTSECVNRRKKLIEDQDSDDTFEPASSLGTH